MIFFLNEGENEITWTYNLKTLYGNVEIYLVAISIIVSIIKIIEWYKIK
jgi:hypothetical protein